ncbi:MAG: hypothetical protein V2I31_00795 [Mariniphaga sp.]|nr:hypothetical protein [Mariniphaga sp.]
MKVDNKIEKPFGRTAVFVGVLFLLVGSLMLLNGAIFWGILVVLFAALVVFTYSGIEIDTENYEVRQYSKWFGLFKTGKWKSLRAYIGVTLVPITTRESMASWSNRVTSNKKTDYRIYLVNKARKPAFAIKACPTREEAQNSLDEFSIWLKVPVFSVKR